MRNPSSCIDHVDIADNLAISIRYASEKTVTIIFFTHESDLQSGNVSIVNNGEAGVSRVTYRKEGVRSATRFSGRVKLFSPHQKRQFLGHPVALSFRTTCARSSLNPFYF
jgi:hypothetical protein